MLTLPELYVERIVGFAGAIFIEGWRLGDLDIVEISVSSKNTPTPVHVTLIALGERERPDVAETIRRAGSDKTPRGFIAKVDFPQVAFSTGQQDSLEWAVRSATSTHDFFGPLRIVGRLGTTVDQQSAETIRNAISLGLVEDAAAAVFLALQDKAGSVPNLVAHIDSVGRANGILGCNLWLQNAATLNLFAITDDGLRLVPPSAIQFFTRPDVTSYLTTQEKQVTTDRHGLFFIIAGVSQTVESVIIFDHQPGRVTGIFRASAAPTITTDVFVGRLFATFSSGAFPDQDIMTHLIEPLLRPPERVPTSRLHTIAERKGNIQFSIIVPLYKEYYFLRSLLSMQLLFGDCAEWIFVCDDPDIEQWSLKILRGQSDFCRSRTVILINAENYGFSTANEIGVSVAESNTLLFMNSDIWVRNVSALKRAQDLLEQNKYGALGFRLLYEDGTVQHDGMTFERRDELGGLFAVEHPGKGLPPINHDHRVIEVTAVTAALLMIRKDVLARVGGFSREYVLGDFEDADLCLAIRRTGQAIGLVMDDDLFHLERQSIRKLGQDDYRQAITYLNCIKFNRKWGEELVGIEKLKTGGAGR